MKPYSQYRPTKYDQPGLNLPDRQDWLVVPVGQNRDSPSIDRSNFAVVNKSLEAYQNVTCFFADPDDEEGWMHDYEVHCFNHWAVGWVEIIIVRPNTLVAMAAEMWEDKLEYCSYADEHHHSELCFNESQQVWKDSFSVQDRLAYIRKHRRDFEFQSFADMLGCVRGKFFCGDVTDIVD